ncbi:hypothetical protein B1B04_08540 [Lysinibacillus sp. KCTC 33748]|uniref:hypothetical protein n=1 Tax=unclassified Lysinibacillus TaxID=2636778 RepID=UPI0009A81FD9|nr:MULTISPECIES: hypothetical protein [unclassified Lysinibacillus]OXS74926.1 hypothetical protein B1B04_08540 [Lysinibacillus sp. KCTC 33748]SKB60073.1 hypothetical protein SAMN06295926_104191 [Lysinibacillus sp. AC-3]
MNEIQPLMIDLVQQFLSNLVAGAKVTIDGVVYDKEIYHTSTKYGLRKYVKLSLEQGLVTRAALVDSYGRELYVKTMNYQKGSQGYVIAFPLQLEVKEVKVSE